MLFEKFADDYARFRPNYPADLVKSLIAALNIGSDDLVLDLACGTGQLGKSLRKLTRTAIIGLDRSLMLVQNNPHMPSLNALAETQPIKSASVNAVIVGQAFHWFNFGKALGEIWRILKARGGLAIVWYRRARPLHGHHLWMDELLHRINPGHKNVFMDYDWPDILKEHGGFSGISKFETEHILKYSKADYLKLQRSKSYIGDALKETELTRFINEFGEILTQEFPDGIVQERLQYFYVGAIKA